MTRTVAYATGIGVVALFMQQASARPQPGPYKVAGVRIYYVHQVQHGRPVREFALYFRLNRKAPTKANGAKEAGALIDDSAPPGYRHPRQRYDNPAFGGWGAAGGTNSLRSPGACYVESIYASSPPLLPARAGRRYKVTIFAGPATLVTYARLVPAKDDLDAQRRGQVLGC